MLRSVKWCAAFIMIVAAFAYAAEDAITALGTSKGEPISKGFVFKNGKYVSAPYVVDRRGLDIYIGDELMSKGPEWPPYDFRVNEDPGAPPAGTSPIDSIPPGIDGRDTYWAKKARYVFQHNGEQAAREIMVELYRSCPKLARVDWDQNDAVYCVVVDSSGKSRRLVLAVDRRNCEPPRSNEQLVAAAEETRKLYETYLTKDAGIFNADGSEAIVSQESALAAIQVLMSAATTDDKIKALHSAPVRIPTGLSRRVVAGFAPDSELSQRYEAALKEVDAKRTTEESQVPADQ